MAKRNKNSLSPVKSDQKYSLVIIHVLIILALVLGTIYLLDQFNLIKPIVDLVSVKTEEVRSPVLVTTPQPSTITNISDISLNWPLYKNDKFGFTIKYPAELNLTPTEVNVKADYRDYVRKCDAGILDGCGGGIWPDYKISFLRPNKKAAFDVRIYQYPVSDSFGGVERDNFTFIIQAFRYFDEDIELDPVDKEILKSIEKTMQFYKPTKPLSCLWDFNDSMHGFTQENDAVYIENHFTDLVKVDGVSFSQSIKSCVNTSYYIWKSTSDTKRPPFNTIEECVATCLN